jgi:NAD(P)-dependent dehydrogenase (short-subunit alcohol dehydrogenase family)
MDLDLTNKVAVITGASKGIGRSIAETLSREGMRLVIAARSGDLLQEIVRSSGANVVPFEADLREENAPAKLIALAVEKFGTIDLLVNNAGATKRGDFLQLTDDDWRDGFALKFYCAVRSSRAAWPYLAKAGGSIVNIVGIGGRTASADFSIGGSVNAALLNLTKALAERGNVDGVRVNAINPGWITTDRLRSRIVKFAGDNHLPYDEAASQISREMGVRRFGNPEEIASAVAFLASGVSGYSQGTIFDIDGGTTKTL